MYYINYFFIFSIIGYLLEFFFNNGVSGILYGPYTPVYGIGVCIIIFISKKTKYNPYMIFILNAIILTIIELIGGILIEKIFDTVFWDYSQFPLHIGKYISIEMSLIWGFASLFLTYFIKPIFDKFIKKIPKYISWVLIIVIFVDLFFTILFKG